MQNFVCRAGAAWHGQLLMTEATLKHPISLCFLNPAYTVKYVALMEKYNDI